MKENQDFKYWVALSRHQKIGARTFYKLYKRFKTLEKVWQASNRELSEAGLDLGQIEAIGEIIEKIDPQKELAKLRKHHIEIIIYPDENYPKLLKEIPDAPGILYLKGKILPQDEIALAVVGSRKYTNYGRMAAQRIVDPIARNRITIISGLALGIDSFAHQTALDAGGRTIAVLGCGLDQIYPISNIKLADRILKSGGAIISEYPLGMPALRHNFPVRNRIIAGLSLGTLVVECAEDSGSLLTASAAITYNREVFAVPGEIFSETSAGTNKLIKMGARIVTAYTDILEELAIEEKVKVKAAREVIATSKDEEIILNLLKEPKLADQLMLQSGLEVSEVNSLLVQMEMKGLIRNLGGTRYVRNGKLL